MDIKEVLELADRDMYRAKREKKGSDPAREAWIEQPEQRSSRIRVREEIH
jgi:hypothetical protein